MRRLHPARVLQHAVLRSSSTSATAACAQLFDLFLMRGLSGGAHWKPHNRVALAKSANLNLPARVVHDPCLL